MQDISCVLAEKMTSWFEKNSESSELELITVKYGLELLIENIIKAIVLICIAIFMDKVLETIIVIGVFSILRLNAGGIHMRSSIGCSLGMLFVWSIGVFGSTIIVLSNVIIGVLLVVSIIVLFLYAPCVTKNNPITDINISNKKKLISIIFVLLLSVIIFLLNDKEWKVLILIPIILEIITILPVVNYINQIRLKEDM